MIETLITYESYSKFIMDELFEGKLTLQQAHFLQKQSETLFKLERMEELMKYASQLSAAIEAGDIEEPQALLMLDKAKRFYGFDDETKQISLSRSTQGQDNPRAGEDDKG